MPTPIVGSAGAPGGQAGIGAGRKPAGPGVYTQMIRESSTPTPELPSAKPVTAPPPPKARTIPMGLIIALNVVLVLAIVLILYFVFRPATPGTLPDAPEGTTPTAVPPVPKPALPSATLPKPTVPAVK